MLNLSIGVLTHNSPDTLFNTLITYKDQGLFNVSDDVKVWIQDSLNAQNEQEVCERLGINFIRTSDNNWIASGFKGLAEHATHDTILLLENDFSLSSSTENTEKILSSGVDLLLKKEADVIRLRSRRKPGAPNWGPSIRGRELKEEFGSITHLCACIYWTEAPEEDYPNHIEKINTDPLWYRSSSRYCNFTNNPCIYRKGFYKEHIFPWCEDKTDIETACAKWWCQQDFKCVFGEGLFTHGRTDGINHEYR